ncbi:L-ornithine N(5)-monooxygenase [subsurface metagenome]
MPHKLRYDSPSSGGAAELIQSRGVNELYDLIGIGFGPASLAIAVAIYDILEERIARGRPGFSPKLTFLERQPTFGWHAGMLLPGTKMQISFIKDLATMRNPRSHFTFLNYLKQHNRLVQFCNLDTFLPLRIEFEDYLKWSASHFSDAVQYAQDVTSVKPLKINGNAKVNCLEVTSNDISSGVTNVRRGRSIVIAVGGRPSIPPVFPTNHAKIVHSSKYNQNITQVLPDKDSRYRIAVVGGGQSAAEVFNDLQRRFPNSRTTLMMRDTALRPSDDSPFVNEVFNPEVVDQFYSSAPDVRKTQLKTNRATNYSVVRLNLLEEIYENMYHQRLQDPNPENWQHRILSCREIVGVSDLPSGKIVLAANDRGIHGSDAPEEMQFDAVVLATGYIRDVHNQMLKDCQFINGSQDGTWTAERDYQVQLNRDLVEPDVSIYLQGCNEQTHGLSDSLLSILATRGGEIVDSVFGKAISEADTNDYPAAKDTGMGPADSLHCKSNIDNLPAVKQYGLSS